MAGSDGFRDILAFTGMVSMECVSVSLNTLFKAATTKGMSYHVFVVYAYAMAALILSPAPFLSYRSKVLPPLSFSILCRIGLLAIIGGLSQILGYSGINYSSPTLASAFSNLTPALTFILAIIFGMEKVAIRRKSTQAKCLGTIVSIAGAFVMILYKGSSIVIATSPTITLDQQPLPSLNASWILGGIFLSVQYVLVPLQLFVQAQIMKDYPAELTIVFYYNLFVSIVAAIVALSVEGASSAWKLQPNTAWDSVFCTGLFASCLPNIIHTRTLRLKGPVYVAKFKPLSIAIAFAMGIMFLGDSLHLGSLTGALVISIGFYMVIWGKSKDLEQNYDAGATGIPTKLPLAHQATAVTEQLNPSGLATTQEICRHETSAVTTNEYGQQAWEPFLGK
ncbi:hypothetical protein Tsubulata_028393 [Turnera subulata]|uniref:WAT1-related protein n=1 Tax=Turnera subulata TaxID=218843 RepID=A0A9Q0JFX3_9ROSI|nr:hypothetical protein Tsubulata_028393 [Turnera subulata]